MHHLTRAAATTVAALALVSGTGVASFAKPPAHAGGPSHAAVCKAQKADVKTAKAELRDARKANKKRGVKVTKAERQLAKEQRQAKSSCSTAAKAADALSRVEANLAGYETLVNDPALATLPAELQSALVTAIAAAEAQVEAAAAEIDGASTPELAKLVNNLRALDPAKLAAAVVSLSTELQTADPAVVALVQDALAEVVAQLAAYDVTGNSGLKDVADSVLAVVELLQTLVPPVAEEPVAEEPVAEEPVAEEPVAEEPVAEEPVAEEPVTP